MTARRHSLDEAHDEMTSDAGCAAEMSAFARMFTSGKMQPSNVEAAPRPKAERKFLMPPRNVERLRILSARRRIAHEIAAGARAERRIGA